MRPELPDHLSEETDAGSAVTLLEIARHSRRKP